MKIEFLNPRARDQVGFIPDFLYEHDPRPAREQFNQNYAHGGGWRPFEGFEFDATEFTITYPGDPSLYPIAKIEFRTEVIFVYPHAWVGILLPDGGIEIARMD